MEKFKYRQTHKCTDIFCWKTRTFNGCTSLVTRHKRLPILPFGSILTHILHIFHILTTLLVSKFYSYKNHPCFILYIKQKKSFFGIKAIYRYQKVRAKTSMVSMFKNILEFYVVFLRTRTFFENSWLLYMKLPA